MSTAWVVRCGESLPATIDSLWAIQAGALVRADALNAGTVLKAWHVELWLVRTGQP